MKSKRILTINAEPGMTLAKDVYTTSNILVIGKGCQLTQRIIARLKFYSIHYILIQEEEIQKEVVNEKKVEPKINIIQQTHIEQLRTTEEFHSFEHEVQNLTTNLKEALNKIVTDNNDINTSNLLSETETILQKSRNGSHLFEMLHCMRDYDDLTYLHSINVSLICNIIGRWLHFSEEKVRLLTIAGMLHDIGKLMVPKEIVNKPSRLTNTEYIQIQTHTIRGYNLLKGKSLDPHIVNAALMHHERCDGTGYPNHLKSDQIDEFAKIVSIADVYDAMTATRVYRGPICPFEVINIFESEGLLKYDPKYLLPFLEGVVETYLHYEVQLSDGRTGEIIMINKHALSKPIIKCGDEYVDLSAYRNLTIQALV